MPFDPRVVTPLYPDALSRCRWVPLGSGGGFSGSHVWRGDDGVTPTYCLKCWPEPYSPDRLQQVHRRMTAARSAGLPFVPTPVSAAPGDTVVEAVGRTWDVTDWMPGTADFRSVPTPARLTAVCSALASLHRVWAVERRFAPCPAVARRLALLNDWQRTVSPRSFDLFSPPLRELFGQAYTLVAGRFDACRTALSRWVGVEVVVFPCLCDPHHDHWLFEGDRLTGVIDFGAMKVDSPAVDLARALGDCVGPRSERFDLGLRLYADADPPVAVDQNLVRLLADTGVVGALANWQVRSLAGVPAGRVSAVAGRLERLLDLARPD